MTPHSTGPLPIGPLAALGLHLRAWAEEHRALLLAAAVLLAAVAFPLVLCLVVRGCMIVPAGAVPARRPAGPIGTAGPENRAAAGTTEAGFPPLPRPAGAHGSAPLAAVSFPSSPGPQTPDPMPRLDAFFAAIRQVESGGERDLAEAVGDQGRAIGPYQIWRCYWEDAAAADPSIGGRYEDVRDERYAERAMLAYWRRWCPEALAAAQADPGACMPRAAAFKVLARTHNGGPRGALHRSTLAYWRRVQAELRNPGT